MSFSSNACSSLSYVQCCESSHSHLLVSVAKYHSLKGSWLHGTSCSIRTGCMRKPRVLGECVIRPNKLGSIFLISVFFTRMHEHLKCIFTCLLQRADIVIFYGCIYPCLYISQNRNTTRSMLFAKFPLNNFSGWIINGYIKLQMEIVMNYIRLNILCCILNRHCDLFHLV